MKLYGIPNCDTVKKARTFLQKKKVKFEFIDFKKTPPCEKELERWTVAFGGLPLNTKGQTYKKHKDEFLALAPKAQLKFIIEHSSMIKRPILERGAKVLAFGFDEIAYQKVL